MSVAKSNNPSQPEIIDEKYVLSRYKNSIGYYWGASTSNKKAYKRTRSLTIILGALVTLISSLASASFVEANDIINTVFAITTPIVAALLTIIGGFAQSFHWGATWRDMVINAERLEKERDRFLATKPEERDIQNELDILNTLVIEETRSFFQRVLDSEVKPKDDNS
jgi:hypothetical protein